eukprot:gene12910-15257_t
MFIYYMKYDRIYIITVAKVGSSDFLYSCEDKYKFVTHTHDLQYLKHILANKSKCLIIVGVRDPIARNLSYLFQTYNDDFFNEVKTKYNDYQGEYCFIKKMNINSEPEHVIRHFFAKSYHNTFNEWFQEFFEITKIDQSSFDKDKGLSYYDFPNDNMIMVYTLETLNKNQDEICELLDIPRLIHGNNSSDRHYRKLYEDTKKTITYTKEYLNNSLNTDIMKFFYTDEDILNMYSKYRTI